MWRTAPTAVASISLAAVDDLFDEKLVALNRPDLTGKTAIAMARLLYARFREIFDGPRWQRLAARGARVLRPKWTRIKPFDESRSDTFYADALIGSQTVITFSPPVLDAFLDHGTVALTIHEDLTAAAAHLAEIENLGLDLEELMEGLQLKHLAASDRQYQSLIQSVIRRLYVEVPRGGI